MPNMGVDYELLDYTRRIIRNFLSQLGTDIYTKFNIKRS